MKTGRRVRWLSVAVALVSGAAVLAQGPAPQKIRVLTLLGRPLQIVVAEKQGLFAKYGIAVETANKPNSDVLRASLAAGEGDLAYVAVDNAVAMVELAHEDVVIVMGGEGSQNELIAQPEMKSIQDLRGKTLIVDAPNTAYALQMKKILSLNGLRAGRDYEIKPYGVTPQRLTAMREHKEYAGSMLGPPTSIVAQREGFVSLGSVQEIIGPYQAAGFFPRRQWAQEHRDTLIRYLAACIEAQRWMMAPANRQQVIELMVKDSHLAPEVAAETYESSMTRPGGYAKNARFDLDGFTNVLKLRAEVEGEWGGHPPSPKQYYDPSYYDAALAMLAQAPRERTLDEIKGEALKRAENGMYPLIGLDPADVREAFASIKSLDNDEWAAAFSAVADRYTMEGKSLEASDPAKANADYIRAWRIYSFGRWPVPASRGKQRAYAKALDAFLAHARLMDPPLEVVRIPFEGSEIVGYLRLPKNAKVPVPLVLAISGLDSRKEDLSENFGAILPYGIGFLAVDSPGTGQAPIKASETAERMFSRVLDYVLTRPEVDRTRIGVDGQSFGAYWATKLAIIEHARLKAVVAQSPPVHATFQKDFLLERTLGNREYLFGLVPALMSIYEGAKTVDDLVMIFSKMSLVSQNLLGKPTAPMLLIAGALDTQVPISDTYLLLNSGDVPKEAWINPQGGHLGRQVKVWPDPVIFRKVIMPWLVRNLGVEGESKEARM